MLSSRDDFILYSSFMRRLWHMVNFNNRMFRIELTLEKPVTDPVLELRIYDTDDRINPMLKKPVNNRTLIEQDF